MVGVAVRVYSRMGEDLGPCHVPLPVEVGDVLELGHGPILLLRVIDLIVETPAHSPLSALVKVSPAPMLVRWFVSYLRIEERELEAGGRAERAGRRQRPRTNEHRVGSPYWHRDLQSGWREAASKRL